MIIAVDFDGTIVEHRYPDIGREKPFAIETLKKLAEEQHRLILWTVRKGKLLQEAVDFCRTRGLDFYAVNRNFPEENEPEERKLRADLWIDDRNLGGLPDWGTIYRMIRNNWTFDELKRQDEFEHPAVSPACFFRRFFRKAKLLLGVLLLLTSCTSYQKIPYLQDFETVNATEEVTAMYDAHIRPKDLLTITVNTTDPEAAAPFNLTVQSAANSNLTQWVTQQAALQQYLVDNQGNIDFPVLGELHLGGLSMNEAESMIREKLQPFLKETPIVTVRMVNYKISVLGEVAKPGTFIINNEKVNVLEALAMAGDMTIWGLRDNVKLVREEEDGKRNIVVLDLNRADIVKSPYYHLQQNDILYVSPNKTKAKNSDTGQSTSLWVSATSILVSIASLLVTIFK